MAWVTPRTWNPSEVVTAPLMNTIRDALNALAPRALFIGLGAPGAGVISTGIHRYIEVPVSMKITGWTLLADAVGSIVIDVWKDTYGNFPPTVADTITGSEKPTLSSAQKAQDLTLSTWTDTITAGEVLAINVDSASTVQQVTLTLRGIPA